MPSLLVRFLRNRSGTAAAEYVLLISLIGVAILTGMVAFGDALVAALLAAADSIGGY